MKNVITFLSELSRHNDRPWFEANRPWYEEAKGEFDAFTEQLISGISGFDPSVAGLTVKDCTYRIYRDVRFSNNKDPYKTHMGAYVCPHGKKSGYAGYYFHIEPTQEGMVGLIGGNAMTAGLYMPDPEVLRSVRWEIAENGEALEKAIGKARGFTLGRANSLKRLPAGFTPGSRWDDLLKLKDIYLTRDVPDDFLLLDNLAETVTEHFARTLPFMQIINRAVQYAFDQQTDD